MTTPRDTGETPPVQDSAVFKNNEQSGETPGSLKARIRERAEALRLKLQYQIRHDTAEAVGDYSYLPDESVAAIEQAFIALLADSLTGPAEEKKDESTWAGYPLTWGDEG